MSTRPFLAAWLAALLLMLGGALAVSAHDGHDHTAPTDLPQLAPAGVAAACPGGPVIDGLLLDECITRTFLVGGTNKSIKVWYTKVVSVTQRVDDGTTYNLQHWINSDAEAQQVAAWFEDAWQRFFADGGHHLYDTGCGNTVNVRMEDGIGWSGIAYWGSPGNCWIGIDSPMVRGGGGQWTVYHEAQHYLQYSYDSGCYDYLRPNYPDDAEFIEGYADLGADSVNTTSDAIGYGGISYNSSTSMYDKSYGNIFLKYFVEQLGTIGTPADAWHHMDAMYNHYAACDAADNLYVLDTLIPTLKPGMSEHTFFLNFFAANWAKNWADPATQPELVYTDDDGNPYGTLATLTQNVSMGTGTQSWTESTPDDWAANYYQVTPQSGCPYLQVEVDGAAGAQLGINLMAADTTAPTKVLRTAKVGEDLVRTFAAFGVHDKLVAAVNSFNTNYSYTVRFSCVTPTVNILEPRQVKFALVGEPASPIAFLTRWTVTDGASSVRGLPESSFTFDAEGAAATVVPGTFQEVGDEYWAVLLPPVKPAGTTFVDFQVNLGAVADTETDALLYVAPGNSDIALSFDASASMDTEDTLGEGSRLVNAKKAGQVIADLLRVGDRLLVQDWSAVNAPAGCGLPGGDGNCPLDVRTLLPLADADAASLGVLINLARAQINSISAREWTPVGGGVRDAKDALQAGTPNENPEHIFLLSDGQENVNPLYSAVRDEMIDSGAVVHTIGFGPEAPGALLAQIASDTGGTYRPVATSIDGSSAAAASALDTPEGMAEAFAAPFLPGQLGLANVYDYLDTEAENGARIANFNFKNVPAFDQPGSIKRADVNVDKSVNQLRLLVAGKQPDDEGCTNSDIRKVEVQMPGMDPDKDRWIPISPPVKNVTPADWDIRNNRFDDVLVVTNPAEGTWRFRTYYFPNVCITATGAPATEEAGVVTAANPGGATDGLVEAAAVTGAPYAFFMNVSVQSTIQLEGRLLGLSANQGSAGDVVNIVGMLLDKNGTLPAQEMEAIIEMPNGTAPLTMKDDGLSGDGVANDNIYGAFFSQTTYGGGYSVRIRAEVKDPANPTQTLEREWNGGFYIKGPKADQPCGGENDQDKDCMPDPWERRCKLDLQADDRRGDPDGDGLTNIEELNLGTLPCRADTDKGGENDGSEVRGRRNPLNPQDDRVRPLGKINLRALNSSILIDWTRSFSYTGMLLYIAEASGGQVRQIDMGQGNQQSPGTYLLEGLKNDTPYLLTLQGYVTEGGENAFGDFSEPESVTPKADPDMPSGAMLIDNGAAVAMSRRVVLDITATDTPLDGAAQGSAAHMTDQLSQQYNTVSGGVEMRVGNDATLSGAAWQQLAPQLPWTLTCPAGESCTVYIQFRDRAGNESLVVNDSILLDALAGNEQSNSLFLPFARR